MKNGHYGVGTYGSGSGGGSCYGEGGIGIRYCIIYLSRKLWRYDCGIRCDGGGIANMNCIVHFDRNIWHYGGGSCCSGGGIGIKCGIIYLAKKL